MAALPEFAKLFVVGRLACYDSPTEVMKALKEEHGIEATRSQVQAYDPTTAQGSRLSPKLTEIFETTRKQFLADTTSIPIANKAVRLRMLQRAADAAAGRGNHQLMSTLLEQAAKEVGNAFTNRHHVNLKGRLDVPSISDQQLVGALAKYGIHAALPGTTPGAGPEPQDGGDRGGA